MRQDSNGLWTLTDTVYSAGLGGTPYRDGSYEYYIHDKAGPDDPERNWSIPAGVFRNGARAKEVIVNIGALR